MTRRALIDRPEDPRTTQLRKELDEFRRTAQKAQLDSEAKIRDLTEKLRLRETEQRRMLVGQKDVTQLQA